MARGYKHNEYERLTFCICILTVTQGRMSPPYKPVGSTPSAYQMFLKISGMMHNNWDVYLTASEDKHFCYKANANAIAPKPLNLTTITESRSFYTWWIRAHAFPHQSLSHRHLKQQSSATQNISQKLKKNLINLPVWCQFYETCYLCERGSRRSRKTCNLLRFRRAVCPSP